MSNRADGYADQAMATRSSAQIKAVPDRVWVPGLGAVVLALVFVGALLVRVDGDVSLLVNAAPPDTSAETAPSSLTVKQPGEGFDGQFFYRLGVSPWSTNDEEAGVTFDLPSLRNARWGYGALAWVASGGDTDLVPWSLVALNVGAMAAVGAIGGALARSSGRHAAWGLLFALWPGFAYSLSMDTSELVASAFLLAGLLTLRLHRWGWAAMLFSAALITRDTTAAVPAAVALAGAWLWLRARVSRTDAGSPIETGSALEVPHHAIEKLNPVDRLDHAEPSHRPNGLSQLDQADHLRLLGTGVVPLLVFGGWQLVQRARFGELPLTSSGDNNLNAPLSGLFDQLTKVLVPSSGNEAFRLACITGLLVLLGLATWALRTGSSATAPWERAAWVLSVAVVAVLNAYLWSGATAFMRATTEAGLLSILVVIGIRHRHSDRLLALTGIGVGGLWLLTAVAQLTKVG